MAFLPQRGSRTWPACPGIEQVRNYQRSWLRWDVLAGITVAAYLVPQCMAYGVLAGLNPVWFAPASLEAAMSANCSLVYQIPVPDNRFPHTF